METALPPFRFWVLFGLLCALAMVLFGRAGRAQSPPAPKPVVKLGTPYRADYSRADYNRADYNRAERCAHKPAPHKPPALRSAIRKGNRK